ncbi:hypothetical protein K490DRAFT_63341 [Saccharata proteae CBS 121410]|uniref:Uncharacterized protein n=1 Tax=Saccharata proteae CBS 121410 TaxID=1314787 RepID=A0A9P4M0R6_9PEZI|nr:hypothetical protein K490DRAFT_63341 [Saccharata proteae CBS 121410]
MNPSTQQHVYIPNLVGLQALTFSLDYFNPEPEMSTPSNTQIFTTHTTTSASTPSPSSPDLSTSSAELSTSQPTAPSMYRNLSTSSISSTRSTGSTSSSRSDSSMTSTSSWSPRSTSRIVGAGHYFVD